MDATFLTAMSGVLGSFVGASAAVATAWITQRALHRRELVREEIRKRETLYGEFIAECSKVLVDAFMHTLEKPETLLPVYALINRIRLCASRPVLAQAEDLLRLITQQYFSRNLDVEQLRELALSQEPDPMKAFGEACRAEFKAMRARV